MSHVDEEASLLKFRDEFPTLATSVHLISHSLGAAPRRARQHIEQFLEQWEQQSIEAWHDWLPYVNEIGNVIADVIGVPHDTVVMSQNCSTVQAAVASGLEFSGPRRKVVYSALNFSTVHYVWQETQRRGAELCVVPGGDGIHAPMDALIEAIDERTLIVPISHVLFRSSAIKDIPRIVERAHKVGAMVFVDCYQSAGTIPLKLADWDVDLACGGSVKWACGGPGAAYLYVKPSLLDRFRPMNTGWFAHEEPFAFDMGPMRYAKNAWRMLGGTPAIPALYSARAGWEIIREIGVEKIRRKSLRQTALLRELCEKQGFQINTPREDAQRGGTICFSFPGDGAVSKALLDRRFFHDYRPACGLRASPHFYTTDEELRAFVDEVGRARKTL
ncbi:MAG: aminotransferase class V-fold PLP-dependent enzyme [Polyangiales bacterium]